MRSGRLRKPLGEPVVNFEVVLGGMRWIAEEMGLVMRNTSFSPNIRDRMDMSAAITDSEGRLVAQAEHIPVHLGSMSFGAKSLIDAIHHLGDGEVAVTNDPYISGTHMNDVMMISPVVFKGETAGFVAVKAHYVDIGGSTPGSLSATATDLYQEGFIIPPVTACHSWEVDAKLLDIVSANSRTPSYVRGDMLAQIAALRRGVQRTVELFERYGSDVADAWSQSIAYVERYTKNTMNAIPAGQWQAEDYIELPDRDVTIHVTVRSGRSRLEVDYSGSSAQLELPVNAVYGVTVSSTAFALKAALDPDLPFNYGFFGAVDITAPLGSVVNPVKPAPVSAGNVETSQRVVDVIFKALSEPLDLPAASQGTMNNVLFGGKNWAFYETVGGGAGATRIGNGASAVQVNMTNTLNTPVEVIEAQYPLRVTAYRIREASGGHGLFRGGDGIEREFEVLEPCTLTVVGDRSRHAPWGVKGGGPGSCAEYWIITETGASKLAAKQTVRLGKGSRVRILTPGGGGYGKPL